MRGQTYKRCSSIWGNLLIGCYFHKKCIHLVIAVLYNALLVLIQVIVSYYTIYIPIFIHLALITSDLQQRVPTWLSNPQLWRCKHRGLPTEPHRVYKSVTSLTKLQCSIQQISINTCVLFNTLYKNNSHTPRFLSSFKFFYLGFITLNHQWRLPQAPLVTF